MLCNCYWIVLYYTVHVTAFCLGGGAFFPDTVHISALEILLLTYLLSVSGSNTLKKPASDFAI